ncbi:glycerate kinase [Thermoleophilia bacterium SCSIO 60948]|nr:glycerate kinase [Thermoleophilia bacterium SCSIO 60948]
MKAVISPDSFKGTHAASEVAAALAAGLRAAGAECDECPVGDGGEGTMEAVAEALDARVASARATDPLGRRIEARFARFGDRALVEVAAASGLALIEESDRDPERTTSAGTGELIAAAAADGAREILVAVGGSATVDGGAPLLAALADAGGHRGARIVALCDVTTPWEDAAAIFGPQKGADEAMVERLAARLDELAGGMRRDPRGVERTGAAGGISGALWSELDAELVDGASFVLDSVGFDERIGDADLVITGEGALDSQTHETGKLIAQVAGRARDAGVRCVAVVGRNELSAQHADELGIERVVEASTLDEVEAAGRELAGG